MTAVAFGGYKFFSRTRVPTLPGPPGWTVYVDPTRGWKMQFPNGWHAQGIKDYFKQPRASFGSNGVLISNIDRRIRRIGPGIGRFDFGGMPATLVAVEVGWGFGGPFGPARPCTDTPTPLSLLKATRTTTATGAGGTAQLHLETGFNAGGWSYGIEAWIGSQASKADRARLDQMVASISFAGVKRARYGQGLNCSDEIF